MSARQVPCGRCGAAAGEPCRSGRSGAVVPVHGERMRMLRALQQSMHRAKVQAAAAGVALGTMGWAANEAAEDVRTWLNTEFGRPR